MKPSFYVCGGGGPINCQYWDDVNGCLRGVVNTDNCQEFQWLECHGDDGSEENEE